MIPNHPSAEIQGTAGRISLRVSIPKTKIFFYLCGVVTMDKRAELLHKIEHERRIVADMIALYCRNNHSTTLLCKECQELAEYADERTRKCPFMEEKSFCSQCKIHCYKPHMREKIRQVMRFSGPRMLFHHPVAALRHLYYSKIKS